jgi:hypothetical protein
MIIHKRLKLREFWWDEENKWFAIADPVESKRYVTLNKVYAFAFMRFVIRMASRNWFRKVKNNVICHT